MQSIEKSNDSAIVRGTLRYYLLSDRGCIAIFRALHCIKSKQILYNEAQPIL